VTWHDEPAAQTSFDKKSNAPINQKRIGFLPVTQKSKLVAMGLKKPQGKTL
jgi:hypothetical protein